MAEDTDSEFFSEDAGELSESADEVQERDLQQYVAQRGNKVFLNAPFFLELRKAKRRLFGKQRALKYIKRQVFELDRVTGELMPKGQKQEIYLEDGTVYVPLEVAMKKVEPERQEREARSFQEVVNSFLKPVTLHEYDEEKEEFSARIAKREGMEDPKEGDAEIFVNVPEDMMVKGPPKPGAFMLATWRGRATAVLPSGQVFSYGPHLREDRRGLFQGWYVTKIEEMALEVAERARERQEQMDRSEVAELRSKCASLEAKVEELETNARTREEEESQEEARPHDELTDFNLEDVSPNPITNVQKAVNLPAVLKSILQWGRDSDVSAEDWLKASVEMAKSAGVAVAIIHEVLIMRLKPRESGEMWTLRNSGEVCDTKSFLLQFKRKFWQPITAIQKLRLIQKAQMTQAQLRELRFNDFGSDLKAKAHEAYSELGIPQHTWNDVDRVMVTLAFLSGIPQGLANEVMKKRVKTLQDHVEWAVFLSTCNRNTGTGATGLPSVGFVGAEGGAAGGQGGAAGGQGGAAGGQGRNNGGSNSGGAQGGYAGGGGGPKKNNGFRIDALCSKCRKMPSPPVRCEHCRFCFKEGHQKKNCPELANRGGRGAAGSERTGAGHGAGAGANGQK